MIQDQIKHTEDALHSQIKEVSSKQAGFEEKQTGLEAKQQSLATRQAKFEATSALQNSPRDVRTILEGKIKSVQDALKASIETNQSLCKSERAKIVEQVEKLRREVDDLRDEAGQFEGIVNVKANETQEDTKNQIERLRDELERKIREIPVQSAYGAPGPAVRQSSQSSWEGKS